MCFRFSVPARLRVGGSPEWPVGMHRLAVRESATPVRTVLNKPEKLSSVDSYERYDRTWSNIGTCSYSGFTDCTAETGMPGTLAA